MENICFFGFDEEADSGFFVHMKHRPNQGMVEFRFASKVGGQTCVYGSVHPINGTFTYPDFHFTCIEPERRWRLHGLGRGWPLEAVGKVVGIPAAGAAPLEFSFDLEWAATIPALDWKVIFDESTSAPGGAHYDQGGRFAGTINIGSASARVDALAYRDHSWGPRNFMQMKFARFIGFVSEDMETYFDGHILDHGDRTTGFSYTVENGEGLLEPKPTFEVLEGEDWDYGYRKVAVTVGARRYIAQTLWNIATPLVAERYLSNIAMVRIELPDGRRGFGIVERGRLFGDEELAGWLAAAAAPAS
jgi:hypothetical protein